MEKINWHSFLILCILNVHLFGDVGCYLPVVMMHGISGSNTDFNDMVKLQSFQILSPPRPQSTTNSYISNKKIQMIESAHPGTVTVSLPLFNGPESHEIFGNK